ncbi:MAG: hypothetical protein RMJ84_08830 [Sandaracinaceae bacterium]|nr:hypothetical protein [Sandaracinaceae bacterium]
MRAKVWVWLAGVTFFWEAPLDAQAPQATTSASHEKRDGQSAPSGQPQEASQASQSGDAQSASASGPNAAASSKRAPEPLAWRNSFFSYTIASTFNTFLKESQLSYDPNIYQFLSFTPRWYLDAATFLFFSFGAFFEFTDDDASPYNRRFQLSDSVVELRRTIPWEGFVIIPTARLTFPTSFASMAAQRYVNVGAGAIIVRPIPEALGMTIATLLRYQRWFAGSNVIRTQEAVPCTPSGPSGCDGAVANEADRIIAGTTINITPLQGFTLSFQAFFAWIHLFDLMEVSWSDLGVVGAPPGEKVPQEGYATRWRNFTYFALGAAYDLNDWFNLSLSVANSTVFAPLYNDDGSIRSPFNPDTQVALTATIMVDGLYLALHPVQESEEGLTPEELQRRRQGLAKRSLPLSKRMWF